MHLRSPRHLRIAAHAELISPIVMLANVFTVHLKPISSLMGPTHRLRLPVRRDRDLAPQTGPGRRQGPGPRSGRRRIARAATARPPASARAQVEEVIPS